MRHILTASAFLLGFSFSCLASVDNGLLSMVPPGAKVISSIDVESARNSSFGQYILSNSTAHANNPDFEQFMQQTGFDPRRDLQDILFASLGSGGPNAPSRFAILARGNFDPARLEAAARAKGATVQNYQGVDVMVNNSHDRQQSGFAFPEVGVAVMADLATLHQIIGNLATPTALDPGMAQLIGQVGPSHDAWFVSMVPGLQFTKHLTAQNDDHPMPQARAFEGVQESSGGVRFGNTVELSLDAVARSPQDATALADVIRLLASTVQVSRQSDPRAGILAGALDSMTLSTSGNDLHVAISLPEKSLEQLASLGPKHGARVAVH